MDRPAKRSSSCGFTGALRRAIEVRDRHCQHSSGCDQPAEHCDVGHVVPPAHRGETSQFNGRLENPTHTATPTGTTTTPRRSRHAR